MGGFTKSIKLTLHADGRNWSLLEPFEYYVGKKEDKDVIVAEEGFITDFASIPRLLWAFWPAVGTYGKAAIIHDWLYRKPTTRTRKEADNIFLDAMGVLAVPMLTKWLLYLAVRCFGGKAWVQNKRTLLGGIGDAAS